MRLARGFRAGALAPFGILELTPPRFYLTHMHLHTLRDRDCRDCCLPALPAPALPAGALEFFRSEAYGRLFEALDRSGGFFTER